MGVRLSPFCLRSIRNAHIRTFFLIWSFFKTRPTHFLVGTSERRRNTHVCASYVYCVLFLNSYPGAAVSAAQAASASSQQARDIEVARVARERRKRQKAAKKERERKAAAASAEAQRLAEELEKKEAAEPTQFCPLWSTSLGARQAFVRLAGELSARIAAVNGPSTPSKRPVTVEFRATSYQVVVFHGTVACAMSPKSLGDEMLALLASGITEERVTALLSRWSFPAPAGIMPAVATGSVAAASSGPA